MHKFTEIFLQNLQGIVLHLMVFACVRCHGDYKNSTGMGCWNVARGLSYVGPWHQNVLNPELTYDYQL